MVDLQEIIKGFEIQLNDLHKFADEDQPLTLTQERAKEILELLKVQQIEIEQLKENIEQLVPVLHGKWENKSYDGSECHAICSQCGVGSRGKGRKIDFGWDHIFPNYCQNCGAKMDNTNVEDER